VRFFTDWPGPTNSIQVTLQHKDYEESWGEIPGYFEHKERQMLGLEQDVGGHLRVAEGSKMRDIVTCYQPMMDFVTQRTAEIFTDAKFSGCQFVRYSADGIPSGETALYRLIITGRCGIVESALELDDKRKLRSIEMGHIHYVEVNSWDGSDFFVAVPRSGTFYFSKRVALAIKKHKLAFSTKERLWTERAAFDALFER
jgi:hypothetical protein